MDKFTINIAGHNLCFKRDYESPPFAPSDKLSEFLSDSQDGDIIITVFNELLPEMEGEKELFSAPYMKEESNGVFVNKSERLWSVHEAGNKKLIRTWDYKTGLVESTLLFASDSIEWKLYSSNKNICINPFSYPLDGLILYYLSIKYGDVIIHASAVEKNRLGYLFSGVSGKGKTTLAHLWEEAGATIIHDDLVVLSQKKDGSIIASGTPLNANTLSRRTTVDALFLIEHSKENTIIPLKGAEALTAVLSNTVQHNYDKEMINNHIGKVMGIVDTIPVYRMGFMPDQGAVCAILSLKVEKFKGLRVEGVEGLNGLRVENQYSPTNQKPHAAPDSYRDRTPQAEDRVEGLNGLRVDAIETIKAVIESGNSVELNAIGYSMFPKLRPGDRVVVKPVAEGQIPLRGSVVVCVDNGAMAEGAGHRAQGPGHRARGTGDRAQSTEQNSILVMHRLIDINNDDSGNLLLITRGDSGIENDKSWPIEQLVGEAVSFKRGKKEQSMKVFIPGSFRYSYNLALLWMFNKIMRLNGIVDRLLKSK